VRGHTVVDRDEEGDGVLNLVIEEFTPAAPFRRGRGSPS
jgi:hypothetical protein